MEDSRDSGCINFENIPNKILQNPLKTHGATPAQSASQTAQSSVTHSNRKGKVMQVTHADREDDDDDDHDNNDEEEQEENDDDDDDDDDDDEADNDSDNLEDEEVSDMTSDSSPIHYRIITVKRASEMLLSEEERRMETKLKRLRRCIEINDERILLLERMLARCPDEHERKKYLEMMAEIEEDTSKMLTHHLGVLRSNSFSSTL